MVCDDTYLVWVRGFSVPEAARGRPWVRLQRSVDLVRCELVFLLAGLVIPIQAAHGDAVLIQGMKGVVVVGNGTVVSDDGQLVLVPREKGLILRGCVGILKGPVQNGVCIAKVLLHTASDLCVCEASQKRGGGSIGGPAL